MTLTERLKRVGAYVLGRLHEPTTYLGLMKMFAAGSWHQLDGSSKGEVIMQLAIFLIGAVEAFLPDAKVYRTEPKS